MFLKLREKSAGAGGTIGRGLEGKEERTVREALNLGQEIVTLSTSLSLWASFSVFIVKFSYSLCNPFIVLLSQESGSTFQRILIPTTR